MGKSSFSLTPDEYVITLKGDNLEFYEHSTAAEIEDCAGAFLPFDIVTGGRKVWILGDTFMSKHVVIFDRDNNRVGFAEPRL
jgi:Eukaryotic aspartyl protease.